jgi:BirA family biotin operon repressor/biotin-[acetyl-CoA-carboxylase] ligase
MGESNLSPAAIIGNLGTRFIGQRVIYYPKLESTMDEAKRQAQQGAAEGTVVIAEEQTAGRGRIKRAWLSPRGSIALSIILYPEVGYLSSLIMVASLGVVHCIEKVTGLKPEIKWPNDVLINGKKVCGILVESEVKGNRAAYATLGIGINVNIKLSAFPEIQPLATSLSHELGRDVSQLDMLRCLLAEIERLYLALPSGDAVYREWRDNLVTLGKKVQVKAEETSYEGIAESVASDGSLLLRQPDGNLAKIVAGDVNMLTQPPP